ncbi:MAG: fibronectin type III domain-containing protein, partial [Candidatus Nitrosotenuis sp.]
GSHTFSVRAIDAVGNTDATPASFTWTIDTTAPDTTITSNPSNPSGSSSASFSFTSTEGGSTFECQIDGGGYSTCTSPKTYSGLSNGSHTFSVRAIDAVGNTDATPASFTWTIDTTAPVAPTLSISQPDGVGDTITVGSSYSITYTLSDPDDVVTAEFYYDTNNSGLDGTAISGACATAPEGTNVTCTWNTTGMTLGSYYIYGIANDGTNPAVSAYSPGQITISVSATAPGQVTGLSLSPAPTQIVLSWTAPSDGGSPITGYKIERESPVGGGWSTIVPNTGSTSTTYTNTGLTQNTQYSYRVSAINAIGTGPSSDPATTSTLVSATVPDKPISLNGVVADTQISLSWQAPLNDGGSTITDYTIEYSIDGFTWTVYSDGVNTNISVILTGLDTTQTYLFRVYAINSVGTSLPSDTVTVSPQTTTEATVTTSSRNPPKIQGVGIYEIIKTEHALNATDQQTRFENYMPYSVYSYYTDAQNYSSLGSFEKVGEFLPTELFSTQAHPIIIDKGKMIQLQVQIQDEYQSSKVEHVAIYFDFEETATIKPGKTYVALDSPEVLSVGDPDKIFQSVKVSKSLENGKLWAIFDITFARPLLTTDVVIETWHESKQPVYAKITKMWEKLQVIKLPAKQPTFGLFADVAIPKIHTSPTCVALNQCFDPTIVEIQKGGIVQWSNDDTTFIHAITSGSPQTGPDNRFNGLLKPGESFQHVFSAAGTYPYYCMIHPWATGIVHVYEKGIPISEEPRVPSENIAGSVQLPSELLSPLVVESLSEGNAIKIQPGDVLVLKTRNLRVNISGFVGTPDPDNRSVQITIIRPDGSTSVFNPMLNEDGNYFLPTALSDRWIRGNYQIVTEYKGNQLGNIMFHVTDDTRLQGFGGVVKSSFSEPYGADNISSMSGGKESYYITIASIPAFVIAFAISNLRRMKYRKSRNVRY